MFWAKHGGGGAWHEAVVSPERLELGTKERGGLSRFFLLCFSGPERRPTERNGRSLRLQPLGGAYDARRPMRRYLLFFEHNRTFEWAAVAGPGHLDHIQLHIELRHKWTEQFRRPR